MHPKRFSRFNRRFTGFLIKEVEDWRSPLWRMSLADFFRSFSRRFFLVCSRGFVPLIFKRDQDTESSNP